MFASVVLILAGGRGRRMEAVDPKHHVRLCGRTLLDHAIERVMPQTDTLWLNSNDPDGRDQNRSLPVIRDIHTGLKGPLAGIHAGLVHLHSLQARGLHTNVDGVLSVPCDSPFMPIDLVVRMLEARGSDVRDIVLAADASRVHPVFGFWPLECLPQLHAQLSAGDSLSLLSFADQIGFTLCRPAHWSEHDFFNINRPEDLRLASRRLESVQ